MKKATSLSETPSGVVGDKLESLLDYRGDDRIVPVEDVRALAQDADSKLQLFPTGFDMLDNAILGIETGELITIGGPTKNGKTFFAQTITKNLAALKVGVLWFTFEVQVNRFIKPFAAETIFYLPMKLKQADLEWLRDRIIEAKLKYDCRVVFIDNLHHVIDFEQMNRNTSIEIGSVIRFLKRLAVEINVCVFILCHSRKPELDAAGFPKEVNEWDLRDSSFIPQESDATLMIQRKLDRDTKRFTNKAIIKVCLHRRTGVMGEIFHVIREGDFLREDIYANYA